MAEHEHDPGQPIQSVDDTRLGYYEAMIYALKEMVVEQGLVSRDAIRRTFERMESKGPHLGARLVARAWRDDAFREALLADGKAAAAEAGIDLAEAQLVVVEQTPEVHNVVVCTLCSCYPRSLLGQPPDWYVSKSYRSRMPKEPRRVLAEFGLQLADDVAVRVHDSNADMRYMVLPMRPVGTDGWSEADLAKLVSRDHLIGVAVPGVR